MCISVESKAMANVKVGNLTYIFLPLTLKDDLDLDIVPLKMCGILRYICMPSIKSLSLLVKKIWLMLKLQWLKPQIWPLTLKNDLNPWHVTPQNVCLYEIQVYTKYQMSISIDSKVMANVKVDDLTCIFYLWPWRMTLNLTNHPSKYAAWGDA